MNKGFLTAIRISMGLTIPLAGCDPVERLMADPQPSLSDGGYLVGPDPMKERNEVVDLVSVLDPKMHAQALYKDKWDTLTEGQKIDLALLTFYDRGIYPEDLALRRNRVQERLLAESNHRCNVFKSIMHQIRSKGNFLLGTLATATGVAGSIVTGADGSRILSGISGIFSGVRAEFNQELFQNLATQVIIQGVDARRREVYQKIEDLGQSKPIELYPVEAAIKDAIFYHGQCSVIVGFEVANESIKTLEDPGLDVANRVLAKLVTTRSLLNVKEITPEEAERVLRLPTGKLPLAGSTLRMHSTITKTPLQTLQEASGAIKVNGDALHTAIRYLALPSNQNTESNRTALETKKAELEMAVAAMEKTAHADLQTCNDPAASSSQAILEATLQLNAVPPGDEAQLLQASLKLKEVKLEGAKTSERINLIPRLFAARVEKAYEALGPIRKELEQSGTIEVESMKPFKSVLEGFPQISGTPSQNGAASSDGN